METSFEQIQIKVDHEIPKTVTKTAAKCAHKTEKKLVDLLKDQSKLIEAIQTSYKEKLVSTRDSLHEMIKKAE